MLNKKQQIHLINIHTNLDKQYCLHDTCIDCLGTGKKKDGSLCVHYISCPCPKCTLTY